MHSFHRKQCATSEDGDIFVITQYKVINSTAWLHDCITLTSIKALIVNNSSQETLHPSHQEHLDVQQARSQTSNCFHEFPTHRYQEQVCQFLFIPNSLTLRQTSMANHMKYCPNQLLCGICPRDYDLCYTTGLKIKILCVYLTWISILELHKFTDIFLDPQLYLNIKETRSSYSYHTIQIPKPSLSL